MAGIADILKLAGAQAGKATNNLLQQGKGPIATPTTKKTSTSTSNPVTNLINTMSNPTLDNLNKVTSVVKATTPTTITSAQALKQGNGPIASTPAQPIVNPAPQAAQQAQPISTDYTNQINQLISALSSIQQPTVQAYQSPYDSQISQLLTEYKNRPAFSFDATNNPTILANQKKAADAVTQEMARRNILNSSITGNNMADRIAEVYATLAPQLEQQAYNQYQDQGNNILQQLQLLQNQDQTNYQRWANSADMANDNYANQINKIQSIIDILGNRENVDYSKTQDAVTNALNTANQTGYYNPYAGVTISPEVQQYSNDYSAEINRRRATPDTADDALISQLEAAKANKIFSSPDMLNKYGDIYKTPAQRASEYNNEIERQKLELEKDPNSLDNQLKLYNLAKAQEELNQLATYGPQQQQAKLDEIQSQVAQNKASASASYASANASNALATQRKNNPSGTTASDGLKYKDYYNTGLDMKNAGRNQDIYKGGLKTGQSYVKDYTDDQIYDWVNNLPISLEQQSDLIDDLGLTHVSIDRDNQLKKDIANKRYNMLGIGR